MKAMGGRRSSPETRLKAVDLSSTSVSDAQLSHLSGLTGLEKLDLQVTQIGDLGLARAGRSDRSQGTRSQQHHRLRRRTCEAGRTDALQVLKLAGTLVEGRGFGGPDRL